MADKKHLALLKKSVLSWNRWRQANTYANLQDADLRDANLLNADFRNVTLIGADLSGAHLLGADFNGANLAEADLSNANLIFANLTQCHLYRTIFLQMRTGGTIFTQLDLRQVIGLEEIEHTSSSTVSTDTFVASRGQVPEVFLRGCGLSDWEIEVARLYNPDLTNAEINDIQYKMYDLRATQALQISPLFISYGHADTKFVDKLESHLNKKGVRFWRDTHEMKAGRIETQIDRAISQNRTALLVLSQNSIKSDWVEHEVRTAREQEKNTGRDVLCPIALDDSWRSSQWPKRVMEQIMEYNILDFSVWEDDVKFEGMFRKLIDGLELFYKG